MKTAIVNGVPISPEAVQFELERLARFYTEHGFSAGEIKKSLHELQEKALEQAIGAKLLLDRASQLELPVTAKDVDAEVAKVVREIGGEENYKKALAAQGVSEESFRRELEKGVRVNMLVAQACSHVDEPTEKEVEDFFSAHREDYPGRTIVDVHDQVKDLLRHESRGRAMAEFVADLRAAATVEYRETEAHCPSCAHEHGHR